MSQFTDTIAVTFEGNVAHAHTNPAFMNMVGPFGGATAATVLNAVLSHPQAQGRPVAVTVNFAAPLTEGAYDLHLSNVRTNRSNQHWLVRAQQGDDSPLTATVVLANDRDSFGATELAMPKVPGPTEVPEARSSQQSLPWTKNYVFRFVTGGIDTFAGHPQDTSRTTLWLRHTEEHPWDYPALMSASDIFFPRIFMRTGTPIPAGTVSMTTYFHADVQCLQQLDADILGTSQASIFAHGMHDQRAELWGSNGDLLVTSSQLVYYKAR